MASSTNYKGIQARSSRIRVVFTYRGVQCRETLPWYPNKANLAKASRLRAAILHEIDMDTFDYRRHFPDSKRAELFDNAELTVGRLLDSWFQDAASRYAPITVVCYRRAIERQLKPAFGALPVERFTAEHLRKWIANYPAGPRRVNFLLVPLRQAFADAFADGRIQVNPVKRVRWLRFLTPDVEPFTLDELRRIISAAKEPFRWYVQFAAWSGLRPSEIFALTWDRVDFERGVIEVRKAVVAGVLKAPKSTAAIRDVQLSSPAREALEQLHRTEGLVFHSPTTDKPLVKTHQLASTWRTTLKRAGVPYRKLYALRHTYASLALSAGENLKWVSNQMGHRDVTMVAKVYGKWIQDAGGKPGAKLELLSGE